MPIDQFGKNVLGKLGWKEGVGIGRGPKGSNTIVEPIEYMPRQHRLGLGAKPMTKEQIKNAGNTEDKRRLNVT